MEKIAAVRLTQCEGWYMFRYCSRAVLLIPENDQGFSVVDERSMI